jgi:hypothetical protein
MLKAENKGIDFRIFQPRSPRVTEKDLMKKISVSLFLIDADRNVKQIQIQILK